MNDIEMNMSLESLFGITKKFQETGTRLLDNNKCETEVSVSNEVASKLFWRPNTINIKCLHLVQELMRMIMTALYIFVN